MAKDIKFSRINVPTENDLRILFLPFRSFLQLVGDLDELKKKDYPEIKGKFDKITLGTEVSKGNTWFPFCMKTVFLIELQCHQKLLYDVSFFF